MTKNINHINIGLTKWFQKEFFGKKLSSPFGIGLLILVSIVLGYIGATNFYFINFGFGLSLLVLLVIYYCIFKPLTGFYITTFTGFFIFYPGHLIGKDLPITPGLEVLGVFLFLGTYLSAKTNAEKVGNLLKTPSSIGIILTLVFFVIEAFNPGIAGMGHAGWFSTFKRYLFFALLYIITYRLIDTPSKIKFYLKFWIALSFFAALYGCFQQWFGYLPQEIAYIRSKPGEYELMDQGGLLRKFSIFSDVVSFGVLSGVMATLSLLLAINQKDKKRKYLLLFFAMVMMVGMSYSGTRTTNILVPAGFALYGFLTIQNKTTLITLFLSIVIGLGIFFAPIYNPVLNRIRTTFDSKEESLNLRSRNRHLIQPYIYAHPIGGGLNTCGIEGTHFYPEHPLAGFPPDSGLLKTALEQGWVGLALTIVFDLLILYQGIQYHFKIRNPEYKMYIAILVATIFPIIVAQYSQVTVGQIPGSIYFFGVLALMKRLMELDDEEQQSRGIKTVVPLTS